MSAILESFGIDQLSIPQRIFLAEEIWASIPDSSDAIPVTDAQKHDLECRLNNLKTNPKSASSWSDVEARLRAKL